MKMSEIGIASFALALSLAACSGPLSARAVDIDVSGVRVILAEGKAGSVKTAVEELCTHLERACGGRLDGKGVHFVVGERPAGEPEPKAFESHVKVADGKVWFWGDDSWESADGWETRQHPGTLFAVYAFLDEVMKVRWPYPGDRDTVVPHRRKVRLPDAWRIRYSPPLAMSEIRNYGRLERKPDGKRHPGLRNVGGRICWCWHDGQVRYRNIRIRELP